MKLKKRTLIALLCALCLMAIVPMQAFAASKKASIKLSSKSKTITVGQSATLTATVTGKSSKVTWKSSNKKIATVSSKGKVTAKKAGKVTITAKANGKTAKCTVTVKNKSWKELYKAFLAKSKVKAGNYNFKPGYFRVLNINGKGVPELIVSSSTGYGDYYVYTIVNNKVKYAGNCYRRAMFAHKFTYCKKYKGIFVDGWINQVGGSYGYLYGMNSSGKKLVLKQHATEYHSTGDSYYYGTTASQSKKVSRSKYLSFCKKYFKESLMKEYAMYANTEANRIRYVK